MLFHQQVDRGPQQVVLSVDKQLPKHLVLYVGDHEFKISESLVMGVNQDIYVWSVDSSPGWSEGQRLVVALLEEYGGPDAVGSPENNGPV